MKLVFALVVTIFIVGCSSEPQKDQFHAIEKASVTTSLSGLLENKSLSRKRSGSHAIQIHSFPLRVLVNYDLQIDNENRVAKVKVMGGKIEKCSNWPKGMSFESFDCKPSQTADISSTNTVILPYETSVDFALHENLTMSLMVERQENHIYPKKNDS